MANKLFMNITKVIESIRPVFQSDTLEVEKQQRREIFGAVEI